jgi:COMPASS component SWD1
VSQQASSATAVKSIEFARRTKSFLINTADRVIRVYKTTDVFNIQDGK